VLLKLKIFYQQEFRVSGAKCEPKCEVICNKEGSLAGKEIRFNEPKCGIAVLAK
jgi:hypothetical protein